MHIGSLNFKLPAFVVGGVSTAAALGIGGRFFSKDVRMVAGAALVGALWGAVAGHIKSKQADACNDPKGSVRDLYLSSSAGKDRGLSLNNENPPSGKWTLHQKWSSFFKELPSMLIFCNGFGAPSVVEEHE